MTQYRILNIEPDRYCDEAREILRSCGEVTEAPLSRQELLDSIGDYDVLITRLRHTVDNYVLSAGSQLKAIACSTTGLDHIDLVGAEASNVQVLSLRGEIEFLNTITPTAEHSWALLLAVIRHLPSAFDSALAGEWNRDQFRGRDLYGQVLGIVGFGRLGEQSARIAQGFGMSVVAYDPYVTTTDQPVELVGSLEDLLQRAFAVVLHVPLNETTEYMIGADELKLMRADSYLINTSRGALVDEAALLDSLANGSIAGAAVDVVSEERNYPSPLVTRMLDYARNHDNLIVTPHIAGATTDSMARTEIFIAHKIKRFLQVGVTGNRAFGDEPKRSKTMLNNKQLCLSGGAK
jgi:D-3-phosphoglycerate dehydrogenase / 2-oxoglutarate reductase